MNESKATRYQRRGRRARSLARLSAGLALAAMAFTPAGAWLARLAETIGPAAPGLTGRVVPLLIFITAVVTAVELAALPAALYQARSVEGPYEGRPRGFAKVAGEQLQATLLVLPGAVAAGAAVFVSVPVAGRWWWALAGILLAAGLALALRGAPTVFGWLAPITPLGRPELAARLAGLARQAGVPVAEISEWDVGRGTPTALVTGVGRARRVLLSPELARTWDAPEVAVVVAHELAHHAHHDLWKRLSLDASVLAIALLGGHLLIGLAPAAGVSGPDDLAALPVLALAGLGVWTAATPLRHAQSRMHERRADRFALGLTGEVEAFRAAIRRLGARHLAEERPSAMTRWFYHRHPSVGERLALADAFRSEARAQRR